jgi:hypothetical protein
MDAMRKREMTATRWMLLFACLTVAAGGCASTDSQKGASPAMAGKASGLSPSLNPNSDIVMLTPESADYVPFVTTPHNVVAEMLDLAGVSAADVLYDLGSGDGRIVIAAARDFGARGVGFELDPDLVEMSNENARLAGVSDRVRFVQQDLFEADLSEATVVTLYLVPRVNMKLRPKLLDELKSGTRVVSHDYGMGDWQPVDVREVHSDRGEHLLLYWVIP